MLRRLLGRPARSSAAIDADISAVVATLREMGREGSSRMLTPSTVASMLSTKTTSPSQLYRMGQAILENGEVESHPAELEKVKLLWVAAMEAGDHNAKFSYARLLKQGQGFSKPDVISATKHFKQLADVRHPWGTFAYAEALRTGDGTKKNVSKAFELYLLCAQSNLPPSYMAVANLYITGDGVDKNVPEALKWYQKAAESGDMHAKSLLGDWHYNGLHELPVNRALGVGLRQEAAAAGVPNAMFNMGCVYMEGASDIGIEKSEVVAYQLFQQAAMKGHALAMMNVAVMLRDGIGITRNVAAAREWLQVLAPIDIHAKEALAALPHE
ncbi:hypothetical protein SPRG_14212 [Saprolegnia parasitica CBS 223.65]|uniref:Uncharacterized protein n=1 Tax=Saprolegnia parasitica (strain CBS 223.65) TaxID=695850 RepID=A0A067BNJ2_SAPPC|nr:hypothetical protein SPRG_14212 [Saprolegnia parasitica CBS 223.65]KDO20064.1 hypothetical protein SPRG_14212 [Saprolegnia parasitica CBS 223.65]|eukprot:XP_012209225.1 hypothetical protein SPRG_14212 [Saprolegnia parasitica CBS 223.65]